jgi:HemY protein
LAQASLEAGDFAAARSALREHIAHATRRVATLMAEIEEAEGDIGRSREWIARAMRAAPDPVWTADGVVSERWLPVSPVSGRLDAFQWKVPVAEIGVQRPTIEPEPPRPAEPESIPAPIDEKPSPPVAPAEVPTPAKPAARRRKAEKRSEQPPEPVIPIVHAPDDPGPEATAESDPVAEPIARGGTWDRFRQLFR